MNEWMPGLKLTYGIESPCYGCQDRAPACHDKCERFAEYKRKVDEIKGRKTAFWQKEKLVRPGIKRSKGKWKEK